MLTKKAKYGLKALVFLAGIEPGQTALVADIAAANQIPKKFLDAILGELRNAGFVHSKKGKGGGYTLARAPEEIGVGNVIRALDGPLAPIQCASRTVYRRCDDCVDESTLRRAAGDAASPRGDRQRSRQNDAGRRCGVWERRASTGGKVAHPE